VKAKIKYVRFQVLTAASMKFRVLWDVAQCNQVDVDGTINLTTRRYIREDSKLEKLSSYYF
jgi:hypothetical protein